jgi:hypothetical protein
MATSIINGLTVHVEKPNQIRNDQLFIEVDESGSPHHAYCRLSVEGNTMKAEALSSDSLGDATWMDAWLNSLSRDEIREILEAARS